jgi:hypothetical protein
MSASPPINTGLFLEHLKKKWGGRPCQMCGIGNWNVQTSAYELRQFFQGNLVVGGGPVIPVIPVVCTNCGNTVLVNALVSGAISAPAAPEARAEAKP